MLVPGLGRLTGLRSLTRRSYLQTYLVIQSSAYHSLDHSRLLYSRLALDTNYQYLDPDLERELLKSNKSAANLIQALQNREQSSVAYHEEEALAKFQDWARSVQLRVGFAMHLNNSSCSKEILNKLISQLTSGDIKDLQAHEIVTLLILIYFRRDMTVEEISEYLDLEELQSTFARAMQIGNLRPEEICAGCLGLKKIQGFKPSSILLRASLYHILTENQVDSDFKDFYYMTIITTLSRGGNLFHDAPGLLAKALASFVVSCDDVSLMTAVKMMTFGINVGYENLDLNDKVISRVLNDLSVLNIKDVVSLTNFSSRTTQSNRELLLYLKGELLRFYESATSISDIVDVLNCLAFMSISEIYRLEVMQLFFDAMVGIEPGEVSRASLARIAELMVRNLKHPNASALLADIPYIHSDRGSVASTLCRVPGFLCFNARIDGIQVDRPMDMNLAAAILALQRKPIPMQIQSPQMSMKNLDQRSRLLVNSYRSLLGIMGSERFVKVARILPQYQEPRAIIRVE